jgi:hypothetical protein
MLDDYVAKELRSKVRPVEISRWSGKRMSNKADKWGRFGFVFWARG